MSHDLDSEPQTPEEAIAMMARSAVNGVQVATVARVVSFDAAVCTVDVEPLIGQRRGAEGVALPVIAKVPVQYPSGAGFRITYPIDKGDDVLLVFSDRSIEDYLTKGVKQVPRSKRRFSISDCFAVPGVRSLISSLPVEEGKLVISNGDESNETKMSISSDGKVFIGDSDFDLVSEFKNLLDIVSTALYGPYALDAASQATVTDMISRIQGISN